MGKVKVPSFISLEGVQKNKSKKESSKWIIESSFNLSDDYKIYFCQDEDKSQYISSQDWDSYFGKYFLIINGDHKSWMYFAMSLHPDYIVHKLSWISSLMFPFKEDIESLFI